jgi:phospholipid N-methyltransferase
MISRCDWDNCKLFVEYGPGVGTFTQHILERLAPDATLLTIDTNPDFTDYLNGKFTDSRLQAVTGSAADVGKIVAELGFESADYILSGLPFSTLPPGVGPKIAMETAKVLRPGGAFLVYQFSPKVRQFIAPYFHRIDKGFEWRNVPPATLFWAWKD